MLKRVVNKGSSQRRRRRVVLVLYLILVSSLAWSFTFFAAPVDENGEIPAFIFFSILGVFFSAVTVFYLIFSALKASIQRIADEGDQVLDERQRVVRDRAYRPAYQIFTGLVEWAVLYRWMASQFGWWLPPEETLGIAFGFVSALTLTLPTAIVAWNEPDPEPEREPLTSS